MKVNREAYKEFVDSRKAHKSLQDLNLIPHNMDMIWDLIYMALEEKYGENVMDAVEKEYDKTA